MNILDKAIQKLFVGLQYICPKVFFTHLAGNLAKCKIYFIKNMLIILFIKYYNVDMTEAEHSSIKQYENFSEFFTRKLKPGVRELSAQPDELASPVDGTISQIGDIKNGRIFQAKGFYYNLLELVGGDEKTAERFVDGSFATIYLSPQDYHRVHMPCDGDLEKMIYIPGDLFSVNKSTTDNVKNLFTRNERVVNVFNTVQGDVAVIMIGAMIVGSISTTWCNTVSIKRNKVSKVVYSDFIDDNKVFLQQGDEMGKFDLGSTVILLFSKQNKQILDNLLPGTKVKMGQPLTIPQIQQKQLDEVAH